MAKSFKSFLTEASVSVISIDKNNVDLELEETRAEINSNLAQVLAGGFVNPYMGYYKVAKILTWYGITIPQVIFRNDIVGEEVFLISQFGKESGVVTNKPLNFATGDYFTYSEQGDVKVHRLHFEWMQNDKGVYVVKARIEPGPLPK